MKGKLLCGIYIITVVILSVGFFLLGWYTRSTVQTPVATVKFPVNNGVASDEYTAYVSSLDVLCPFVSTAVTGDCLDQQINKQKQLYDSLSKELLHAANTRATESRTKNQPVPMTITDVLNEIPAYNKARGNRILQLCSLQNILTTGSGIVIDSKKCAMYYNEQDIQMLERLISQVKNDIFVD